MPVKIPFILWQAHMQAFFMGLLFFIAGVFAHRSLQRRSPGLFLRERARRLGLPALLYMLLLHPFMVYVLLGHPQGSARPSLAVLYGRYLMSGGVFSGSGPMWFALALLLFCAGLAVWRIWNSPPPTEADQSISAPSTGELLGFGVGLVLLTFLVRLVQPVGTDVLNFQLGFFPQYIAAFAVGVVAGRKGWLDTLATSRRARAAGWLGCLGGPVLLGTIAALGGPPPEDGPNPYAGGWEVRAFAYAAWEQFAGLGIALGALAWFRGHGNCSGRLTTWLSNRAFAVYVLHAPVLVALTPLVRPAAINAFVGAALLTLTGLASSFLLADLARRLPGLNRIL
jgi:hypothetical protein